MERNHSNRDFEQFVKQNADQYRMFPSEKVWKGVHGALHRRRRWYGFGLAFLLLMTGGAVTWVMSTYPVSKKPQDVVPFNSNLFNADPAAIASTQETDIAEILPFSRPADRDRTAETDTKSLPSNGTSVAGTRPDFAPYDVFTPAASESPVDYSTALFQKSNEPTAFIPPTQNSQAFSEVNNRPSVNTSSETKIAPPAANTAQPTRVAYIPDGAPGIEDVTNSFKAKRKRLGWQIFITPTISYRKLSVNKSLAESERLAYPFATLRNVNSAVTHKPDLGFQLGVTTHYPIAKRVNLRAGFQFNINRYDIQAYSYGGEQATIDLTGGPDQTLTAWTNYRNRSGYKQSWLKNYYLSVSVPIGAEFTVFGNKKTSVGVAGTIQPTYVVSDRAYLISTDYKNYAKVPSLTRDVNLSTGFEAFVNYKRGNTRWQVGPQVRYQLLSSFRNPYPVKENLFDFGIKVGASIGK